MTIPEAIKELKDQIRLTNYLSQCSESPGIRAIYQKKGEFLVTILSAIKEEYLEEQE